VASLRSSTSYCARRSSRVGARISFGLSRNRHIVDVFEKNLQRTKVPTIGIIAAVIGLLFLPPFPE
jgi:hypothetical protein